MSESAPLPRFKVFLWLVRRELWEHPVIRFAPPVFAGLVVVAHFFSALLTSHAERAKSLADAAKAWQFMALYAANSFAILCGCLLVGLLYSLDALNGERRDRSILFWKSLPVSDRLTVLSKAVVPMLILPVAAFVAIVAANLLMLGVQTVAWTINGFTPEQLYSRLNLPLLWVGLAYGLPFTALWYAPLYAWVLLVSAWARRMTILWVLAPFLAFLAVEHLALHNTPVHWMLERWFAGGITHPFMHADGKTWVRGMAELEPLRIYADPALWIGVLVAALLLWLTIRLRRSRVPI